MSRSRPLFTGTVRVLRTPHSERFLLQRDGQDVAALDIHYPRPQSATATVVVFQDGTIREEDVPELLQQIDEVLLPDVSLEDATLQFTVVLGRTLGTFSPV